MPVIIISADDFALGERMALDVAQRLGYSRLNREMLDETARENSLNLEDLTRALDEAPGLLSSRRRKKRLLAFIEADCLARLQPDDIVCHGLAAHLYLMGVSHVLKVRVINEPGKRAQALAEEKGVPVEKAEKLAEKMNQQERRWSQENYRLDQTDPSLYDLVISLASVEEDKAAEVICDMVGYRKFQPMTYSRQCLKDKALAARVRRELVDSFPEVRVESTDGTVVINIQSLKKDQRKKQEQVRQLAHDIEGVRHLEVHVIRDYFAQAAQSAR